MAGVVGDSASTDPSQLGGSTEEGDTTKPREFFWDSVVLYLVSVILALSAVDVITEFIRGSGVVCDSPDGSSSEYINNFCASSLPVTEFIPAFIFIHGLLIAIPHYLWSAHYGGYFDYFFSTVSSLERLREEDTGEFPVKNRNIIRQLESAFSTYGRNFVLYLYIGKLLLQFVIALASFILSIVFFTEFDVVFPCPGNTSDPLWPLNESVNCVFTSLKLLYWIRWLDVFLITLVVLSILWGLLWCSSGHSTELGAKDVSKFTFQSGIAPDYYVPHIYLPKLFRRCLLSLFTSIPWPFKSPWISTDLDFLLLKLYRTNAGTGRTFKEVQIDMALQNMIDEDQQIVNLHYLRHMDGLSIKLPEHDPLRNDLKWIFPVGEDGMKIDFNTIPQHQILNIPNTLRGAVLGFAARAPSNSGGLSISFGSSGIALALARLFNRVGSINFSKYLKAIEDEDIDKLISVKQYDIDLVSVTMPENILAASIELSTEVVPKTEEIWYIRQGRQEILKKTSFVVIGPVTTDSQATTLSLLFERLKDFLADGCILLVLQPTQISGKQTSNCFLMWEPPKFFKPYLHEVQIHSDILSWSARKQTDLQEKCTSSGGAGAGGAGTGVGGEGEDKASAIKLENLEEVTKEKEESTSPGPQPPSPSFQANQKSLFKFKLLCGSAVCYYQMATYQYLPDPDED